MIFSDFCVLSYLIVLSDNFKIYITSYDIPLTPQGRILQGI